MEKFKQVLLKKVKDETAAFAVLTAMIITFFTTIGVNEFIRYNRIEQASSNLEIELSQSQQSAQANNFSSLNEIISQEELKKLGEKEKAEKEKIDKETKKENEKEYEKLKNENKISSAADKYYIKVNYGAQVVTVYKKGTNGKYTEPVKAMLCSTGTYTPTQGTYRTLGKGNWWPLMGDVYGQYSTWICDDILFHSVPYLKSGDKSSLEYWAYDQLGQRVSMGCVRLTVKDAKWIYDNCAVGTQVEFYSSSNPGPLGKPSAMKISNAPSNVRGWDPTDPDSRNPWPKYLESLEEANETKNEIANEVIDTPVNDVVNEVADDQVNDVANNIVDNPVNDISNEVSDNQVNDIINETSDDQVNDIINDMADTPINDVVNNEESLQVNSITNKEENVNKTNTTTNDKVNNTVEDELEKQPINDVSSKNIMGYNVYVSELI